jgi:hypothetical protein
MSQYSAVFIQVVFTEFFVIDPIPYTAITDKLRGTNCFVYGSKVIQFFVCFKLEN